MSNTAIIVLDDAEAVPVRALADRLRMHPVEVVKDLRGRGYALGSIRGAAGQWTMALTRMTPNAISSSVAARPAPHDPALPAPHSGQTLKVWFLDGIAILE